MITLLLVALLAQDAPVIENIKSLTGGGSRIGGWLPLDVTIRTGAAFEGVLVAQADTGCTFSREISVKPGATESFLIPVIQIDRTAKIVVMLQKGGAEIARRFMDEPLGSLGPKELLMLVDADHPDAEALVKSELSPVPGLSVKVFKSNEKKWREAADLGILDAVDLLLPSHPDLAMAPGWPALGNRVVVDLRRELPELRPAARFPGLDPKLQAIRRTSSRTRKLDSAILFLAVYAFAIFLVAFGSWSRKLAGLWLVSGVSITSVVFAILYFAMFPRGDMAVFAWQAQWDIPGGPYLVTLHEVTGSTDEPRDIEFARYPKPIFGAATDVRLAEFDVRLRADGKSVVRGWRPKERARFLTVEAMKGALSKSPLKVSYSGPVGDYFNRGFRSFTMTGAPLEAGISTGVRSRDLVDYRFAGLLRMELNR